MEAEKGEVASILTPTDYFNKVSAEMASLSKDFFQKKGLGVYKRVHHFVPASGPGSTNRRIISCETVKGIKQLHQIEDIGVRGKVRVRNGSCHQCEACNIGFPQDCSNSQWTGTSQIIQVKTANIPHIPITRHAIIRRAQEIAQCASFGDFLAIEMVGNVDQSFALCMVNENSLREDGKEIEVTLLRQVTPGTNIYFLTDEVRLFQAQNIVSDNIELEVIAHEGTTRSRTQIVRYRLVHDELDRILRNVGIPHEMLP
jgi:hypothetical protein